MLIKFLLLIPPTRRPEVLTAAVKESTPPPGWGEWGGEEEGAMSCRRGAFIPRWRMGSARREICQSKLDS